MMFLASKDRSGWAALLTCSGLMSSALGTTEPLKVPNLAAEAGRQCAPVHPAPADTQVLLRLALPGIDSYKRAPTVPAAPPTSMTSSDPPVVRGGLVLEGTDEILAGRHKEAEGRLSTCVQRATQQVASLTAAACSNNLAVAYAAQGQHALARSAFEQALAHYAGPRTTPDYVATAAPTSEMSKAVDTIRQQYKGLTQMLPPEARAEMESVLSSLSGRNPEVQALSKSVGQSLWQMSNQRQTQEGIERSTLNLANLAIATGRLGDAEQLLLRVMNSEPNACGDAAAADLGRLYRRLGRAADAQALLQRHPGAVSRAGHAAPESSEMGVFTLASANSGQVVAAARAASPPGGQPAGTAGAGAIAALLSESSGRLGNATLSELMSLAARETDAQRVDQALQAWQRLAWRAAAARRPDLAFAAHAALMRLHGSRGKIAVAILHGKLAANLTQAARSNMSDASPSRDARRAFLRERRQVYVTLAQLLMDQRRLLETEATLQLLKEDEGQQFRDIGAGRAVGRLDLNAAELAHRAQDEEVAQGLRQAEQARLSSVAGLPAGSESLLMISQPELEAVRLRLGLSLHQLPAQLRRQPLRAPYGAEGAVLQAGLSDLQSFLIGPEGRLQRSLVSLIEDAPRFSPPADAQQRARLAENLKNLRQIQAELTPLLRDMLPAQKPGSSTGILPWSLQYKGQEADIWMNFGAEPWQRLWRSLKASDDIEVRQLARTDALGATLASGSTQLAPSGAADETRSLLSQLTQPTALLYYLPGDDRLDVLLVSAKDRQHWRLPLPGAELDTRVGEFVERLRRSDRDPRPQAQALYKTLFAPVRQALNDKGIRVLALSLAGKLRFVPFAALHDGDNWLVQSYALALHPGGPLTGRLKPASANWQAAAFGSTLGSAELRPLANVRAEINSVVRQDSATQGVLPGEAWLDQGFTAQRLRAALSGKSQVVHIASHFKFVGGDAAASYLLLGDGGKLSLQELAGPQYRFDRTELVTLSACTTGLSADDTYGQEVDGLAALLMGQGAPSVLASMWEVDDSSTATLMATLYRVRERGQLSRVVALQQAQLAMLAAATTPPPGGEMRSAERVRPPAGSEAGDRSGRAVQDLGRAHPFHWAPFVLMGNWL